MNIDQFIQHFPDATKSGNGWSATCPAHDDHQASLSISAADDGKILVRCHAGCPTQAVVEAVGLRMRDLFPDNGNNARPAAGRGRGRLVATYEYQAKDGTPLIRVLRYDPKSFSRQRPDGNGGWINGGTGDTSALYKWPELARACAEHGTAYLVEGEKDVEALTRLGLTATTCLGGASKWRDQYADEFVGLQQLIIIADRDTERNNYAGQRFAQRASEAIRGRGVEVKTLCLPAEIEGDTIKDTSDFLQHGRGRAELEKAVADAPAWEEYYASLGAAQGDAEGNASNGNGGANPQGQTLMEFVWANVRDREHPRPSEVNAAISTWLEARGQFLIVDGMLKYYCRDERRFYDMISREWRAWLFRHIPDFGQVEEIGREITASFSKTPLALNSPSTIKVEACHYWAATKDGVFLSNGPETMYRITAEKIEELRLGEAGIFMQSTLTPWRLVDDPLDPMTLDIFKDLSCVEQHKRLILLWAYSLPFSQKRRPILLLHGEIGSGKTMAAQALQALYGLPPHSFAPTRHNEDAFDVFNAKGGIGIVDNVDDAVPWLGNAIDVASTGTGNTRRILYTTSDTMELRPLSALVLTSADATFAGRASTADRILSVEFKRVERPSKDAALFDQIAENRDRLMSYVARAIQGALRQPAPADGINKRHPDFGLVAQRLGAAIGWEDVPRILAAAEDRKELLAFENDNKYLGPLYEFMAQQTEPWRGDAKKLLAAMVAAECYSENEARNVYPAALGKRMGKAWRSLENIFKAERLDMGHRRVEYKLHPPADAGAQGTPTPPQAPAPTPMPQPPREPQGGQSYKRFDIDEFPIQPWTEQDRLA